MKKLNNILSALIYIFFIGIFLLSRTFMGINILGFRIGELGILASFSILIISLIFFRYYLKEGIFSKNVFIILNTLFISFLLIVYFSDGSFLNLYVFKSSTYIWTIGFLFLGYRFAYFKTINFKDISIFIIILIYIYIYSIYGVSDDIQSFFLNFSDKFEYHKGSDILIMFVSSFYLFNRIIKNKRLSLEIFLCFSVVYLPLLLYKSRGAFISLILFVILELWKFRNYFKATLFRNIILLITVLFLALQSVFIVNKSGFLKLLEVEEKVEFLVTYREVPLEENNSLIYFYDGRIFSGDGNLNWRLQIWQDVVTDLIKQNKIFFGYSFNEKIPAMDDPFRSGDDGSNENVHNFLINIIARGGIFHLTLYVLLMYIFFVKAVRLNGISFLNFVLPIILTSFLDASMENSHFPLIYYFIIGYSIKNKFEPY